MPSITAIPISASGISGGVPTVSPPGEPTIIQVDCVDGTPDATGTPQKLVVVTYEPPDPIGSFAGVDVYLDAPDSSGGLSVADGTVAADGNTPAGSFAPTDEGFSTYVNAGSPPSNPTNQVRFQAPAPTVAEFWRVYVVAAAAQRKVSPIQHGKPGESPSFQFFVSPPSTPLTGREYAPNVVGAALASSAEYPAGWTANPNIVVADSGDQNFEYAVKWTWPTSDQNYASLGGVNLVLSDGVRQTYLGNSPVGNAGAGTAAAPVYISPMLPVRPGTTNYKLYLIAYDTQGNSNTLVSGITPEVDFSVIRNTGPAGEEYCALVLADGVHAFVTAAAAVAADGTALLKVNGYWTAPGDPQFGGAEIVVKKPDGKFYTVAAGRLSPIEQYIPQPAAVESWVFYLRSVDINGRRNTIVDGTTPSVTISVGSATGLLNLAQAAVTSFSAEFTISAGAFRINQISANTIVTGQLQVGGGGGKVSEMKIFDTLGSLIGWVGDDTLNSGFVGAWFKQVRIGGSSPSSAPLVADSSGNVSLPASKLTAGTVSAAVTLTAPTLVITAGVVTVNIDSTNYVKITDPTTNHTYVQLDFQNIVVGSTNDGRLCRMGPSSVGYTDPSSNLIWQIGGLSVGVVQLNGKVSLDRDGVYLRALGGGSYPTNRGSGQGYLGYIGGSTYSYWNGTTDATIDLSAAGAGGSFPTGAWTSYTPSTTNLGGVTTDCAYVQVGKTCFVRIHVNGTSNGFVPTVALPFSPKTNGQTFAAIFSVGGSIVSAAAYIVFGSSSVSAVQYNNVPPASGFTIDLIVEGSYETL